VPNEWGLLQGTNASFACPQPLLKDKNVKGKKQKFSDACKHPKLIGNCSRLFQGTTLLAAKLLLAVRALFFRFN